MSDGALRDRHPEQGVQAEIGHIAPVEGLRGVAVLLVIAFHYWVLRNGRFDDPWITAVNAIPPLQVVVAHGSLGVDLFFLITGFLLTLPWFRHDLQRRPAPSARDFYVRRIRRIVPAYYVQLAVLFVVFVPVILGTGFWMRNLGFLAYNIPAHLSFLHYTTPISSASLTLNGALWTLALEFQYYLLLPLVAPLFVRAPWRMAIAFIVLAAAWRALAAHDLQWLVDAEMRLGAPWGLSEATIRHLVATQLPGYLAHFAIGIVLGRAWLLTRPLRTRRETLFPLVMATVALYLVYAVHSTMPALFGELTWLVIPLGFGIAMFALLSGAPGAGRVLLANRPLLFAGRVSYSAYLYHLPLLLTWNLYAPPELGWAGFPAYLALALAVAWLSYRFVERPFMRSRPPRKEPWPTNAAPGASEAPSTSSTTTASGDAPPTTTASSSSS